MMLAQTVFLIALIALFASSAIGGVAGAARAQRANAAHALIVPALETALARYQREIATIIAAQIAPLPGPALAPPETIAALNGGMLLNEREYREAAGGDSPLQAVIDVRPTAQTMPACASASSGPDVARALQCSPFVQESRLSLAVTCDAGPAASDGTIAALAHMRAIVTLRLFAQPPYSALSGAKDAADPDGFHETDTGGFGNALGPFAAPPADDTTIHVVYECVPGSGTCAASAPLPADAPASVPWTNGNGLP